MRPEALNQMLQALETCTLSDRGDEVEEGLRRVDVALDSLRHGALDEKASSRSLGQMFGILCALLAEFPPYRLETSVRTGQRMRLVEAQLDAFRKRRDRAASILIDLFRQPQLLFLKNDFHMLERLVLSLLEPRRFAPFRVIQVGKLADQLFQYSLHLDSTESSLLREMHSFKYPRFGTSGWRARWGIDFDELTAKCVAQAICDFLTGNGVPEFVGNAVPHGTGRLGKVLLVGYDSRAHAQRVAEWVAHVAKQNDVRVCFMKRDTPTPALVYWATEVIGERGMAGIVNCTASHNPPQWQGIKFWPFNGVPAPTSVTDFVAARANQLKLRGVKFAKTPRGYARRLPEDCKIDPEKRYCAWLLSAQRKGIPIDPPAIRRHFSGKTIVIDEMHGASRGYFRRIMRELGVSYRVIHGQKSQKALEQLGYASPEWPYIAPLAEAVNKCRAALGVGFDTDADRFGIVGEGGEYFNPNQILPLLTDHLLRRGFKGKVVRTVPDSRLIDRLSASVSIPRWYKPSRNVVPSYIEHAFYVTVKGSNDLFRGLSVFVEPVGIKYVIEGMLVDTKYRVSYRPGFRDTLLLGGEESSGLTSKGHIPDKDGIWGNLLVMNMVAVERAPIDALWEALCSRHGVAWFERLDVDAGDVAKERLVNYFFEEPELTTFAGLDISFIGGIMYDMVEIQLRSKSPQAAVYLEVRASGTEPLNRIYVEVIAPPLTRESEAESLVRMVQGEVLNLLGRFSVHDIASSRTPVELASVLGVTSPRLPGVYKAVSRIFTSQSMRVGTLECIARMLEYLELRNRPTAREWLETFESDTGVGKGERQYEPTVEE